MALQLILLLACTLMPLVTLASNYDFYINHLHKRNQVLHENFLTNPDIRGNLENIYSRYPVASNGPEEDGYVPMDVWSDLVRSIDDVRARNSENPPQNPLWGEHRVSGGAGEGQQWLTSEEGPVIKPEVKTDKLPAYCSPPNPCPVGMNPEDAPGPCDFDIPDTKEFNRQYIWDKMRSGECSCDEEHMKHCPAPSRSQSERHHNSMYSESASGNPYLSGQKRGQVVGKKAPTMEGDYNKLGQADNPWLSGQALRSVMKKAGPRVPDAM